MEEEQWNTSSRNTTTLHNFTAVSPMTLKMSAVKKLYNCSHSCQLGLGTNSNEIGHNLELWHGSQAYHANDPKIHIKPRIPT